MKILLRQDLTSWEANPREKEKDLSQTPAHGTKAAADKLANLFAPVRGTDGKSSYVDVPASFNTFGTSSTAVHPLKTLHALGVWLRRRTLG
jgi:hypothetical protein